MTSLVYLLFAGICTRNCEYHSWVYFVNSYKPWNAIHMSTQDNLTIFIHFSACSTSVKQILIVLNFKHQISCTVVTFALLNLSSAIGKNAKFAKPTSSNLFLLHQFTATSQYVSDRKYFWDPEDAKDKLYLKYRSFKSCPNQFTNIQWCYGIVHFQKENSHHFSSTKSSFTAFCVWTSEYERPDNISKHCSGTSHIHKIQNTTEISHSFIHQYKVPNHDKMLVSSNSARTIPLST